MEDVIFQSLKKSGEGFYKEKGSKFIAKAYHVTSEESIKEIINALWSENKGAAHVCYGYRLGTGMEIERAQDDGEPSNSAGPPILAQIAKHELTFTLIAVVRYYGGTNLGVGGLINAYRTASERALENAVIKKTCLKAQVSLSFGYEAMSQVMHIIKVNNLTPDGQNFEHSCSIIFEVPYSQIENYKSLFQPVDNIDIAVDQ